MGKKTFATQLTEKRTTLFNRKKTFTLRLRNKQLNDKRGRGTE